MYSSVVRISIAAKHKGNVEGVRVAQCLLKSRLNRMLVVFGLDDCDRDVGLVVEDVVGAFSFSSSSTWRLLQ